MQAQLNNSSMEAINEIIDASVEIEHLKSKVHRATALNITGTKLCKNNPEWINIKQLEHMERTVNDMIDYSKNFPNNRNQISNSEKIALVNWIADLRSEYTSI